MLEEQPPEKVIEDIRRRNIVKKFVELENHGIIGLGEIVREMRKEKITRPNGKIMAYEYLKPTLNTKWFTEMKEEIKYGKSKAK